MRFKVTNADAEKITREISQVRKTHGFTAEDDLTNAGDALVYLLLGGNPGAHAPAAPEISSEEIDKILDDALAEENAQ